MNIYMIETRRENSVLKISYILSSEIVDVYVSALVAKLPLITIPKQVGITDINMYWVLSCAH